MVDSRAPEQDLLYIFKLLGKIPLGNVGLLPTTVAELIKAV